jgi:hypothetical protein
VRGPYCQMWPALALQNFFALSHKRHDFRKNGFEHKMFSFSLEISTEIFLILRRTEQDMIINYVDFRAEYSLFLSDINET